MLASTLLPCGHSFTRPPLVRFVTRHEEKTT